MRTKLGYLRYPSKTYFGRYTHKYMSVSGGKKRSFFGKFGVVCFPETPVLRFALLSYYRRLEISDKQKQPPDVFYEKSFSKNLHTGKRKNTCSGVYFACNFIKNRLQHRCFSVNIAKFLRTSILKYICEQLLLDKV